MARQTAAEQGESRERGRGRGRPPLGGSLVEELSCSELARERLRVVLQTLSGSMTIEAACATLGVGPSRFHAMRTRFLEEAADLLEPRAPGPPKAAEAEERTRLEVDRLKQELDDLRLQLSAARLREELAHAMPGRPKTARAEPVSKKKRKQRVRRSR